MSFLVCLESHLSQPPESAQPAAQLPDEVDRCEDVRLGEEAGQAELGRLAIVAAIPGPAAPLLALLPPASPLRPLVLLIRAAAALLQARLRRPLQS